MISATGLSVSLSGKRVVEDVSFALAAGEFAALTGPNGAGKSTALKALAGVAPLAAGDVRIGDTPAEGLSLAERARRVAWLPQARPVAWNLRVEDVAALGRFVKVMPRDYAAALKRLEAERHEAASVAAE